MGKTLVVCTGGTGGHLMPALAVAEEARMRGYNVVFVTGKQKVPGLLNGFKVWRVHSGEPFSWKKGLIKEWSLLGLGIIESLYISLEFTKDLKVLAAGSFASAPLLFSLSFLGWPFFLLEQNAIPGKTVLFFAKRAKGIFLSFKEAKEFLPKDNLFITGNPIRPSLMRKYKKSEARKILDLPQDKFIVLVLGGSLGAVSLVKEVMKFIDDFKDAYFLIQTGEKNVNIFRENEGHNFRLKAFFTRMNCVYSAIDVAISRAGGTTISEMAFFGIPVILIPFPYAAMNHQHANAKALEKKGAAVVIDEKEFGSDALKVALKRLLESEELRGSMSEAIRNFSHPDATSLILDRMES